MKHAGQARRAALKIAFWTLPGLAVLGWIARDASFLPPVITGALAAVFDSFRPLHALLLPRSHGEDSRHAESHCLSRPWESGLHPTTGRLALLWAAPAIAFPFFCRSSMCMCKTPRQRKDRFGVVSHSRQVYQRAPGRFRPLTTRMS